MLFRGLLFVTAFAIGVALFTQSVTALIAAGVLTLLAYSARGYE